MALEGCECQGRLPPPCLDANMAAATPITSATAMRRRTSLKRVVRSGQSGTADCAHLRNSAPHRPSLEDSGQEQRATASRMFGALPVRSPEAGRPSRRHAGERPTTNTPAFAGLPARTTSKMARFL